MARQEKGHHLIDVAAWLPEGVATFGGHPVPAKPTLRRDLGNGRMTEHIQDDRTGGAFPLMVSAKGAKIDVTKAKASHAQDRRNILHLIAKTPPDDWVTEAPPAECEQYEIVSRNVCRMFGGGAMYRAVMQGDDAELERLLRELPELKDDSISDGATPIYGAAYKNNMEAMRLLLSAGVNVNAKKADGATPVFVAAHSGHVEALEALVGAKADPSTARDEDGVTPVLMAVQQKHLPALKCLLTAKADPNTANIRGVAPAHWAAQEGDKSVIKVLLEFRASVNARNTQGQTPLSIATLRGQKAVAKILEEAGACIAVDVEEEDVAPIDAGDEETGKAKCMKAVDDVDSKAKAMTAEIPVAKSQAKSEPKAQGKAQAKSQVKAKAKGPATTFALGVAAVQGQTNLYNNVSF
eukprot:gnl/MRDRNA2_/MRDRNA2_180890_c0_seq1.p1 gnl/MRDRNA2_/MRDRNA2_180890_c0~~gnl/MRDRNA2_/MRDRNA2_180890_c0_seq1.p1  ORF type:complete len:458 (-),score=112.90 gnl/MRDRNA2_/MRDRNA2_180890_c0_seq1:79-1305(-)